MNLRGRDIHFLRTVNVNCEIARLCPNHDIERIDELLNGDVVTSIETQAKIIHLLNEGYEMNKHFEDNSYQPNVISVEEIMNLSQNLFIQLRDEAWKNMGNGTETSIDIEEPKKKENETE